MHSFEPHVDKNSDYYVYTPSAVARKLFFYPVCTGHFIYEPDYLLKRNNYDSFLIMYITKGSCEVTFQDQKKPAGKEQIVFLDCYAPHQYESSVGWEAYWLHFDGPLCRAYYEQITQNHGTILTTNNHQSIEHTLKKIGNIFRENERIQEATISKYIVHILTELLQAPMEEDNARKIQGSLSNTISYLNEHFAKPISLEDLANKASLSPFYFTRLFTQETGMTPHQYLIATRINAAKFLLKTTSLSIKEIGFSCGFTSESSFCSTFKKWEHTTPSEYRSLDSI